MKLGTLLLRNAEITLTQLEAALRTQVLYGGRLGTNLVELGFLDVDTLTRYLAESLGVPVATREAFEDVPRETIEAFGADRARRFEAFPLANSSEHVLSVAMVEPRMESLVGQLATELGVQIAPHVAPELRIYYYLERHYSITRKARYVRVGTRDHWSGAKDERRRTQPAGGITKPPKVVFAPRKAEHPELDEERVDPIETGPTTTTYQRACATIDRAGHRDDIGDVLIDYTRGRFGAAAIFLLRDNNALGWRLHHADPDFAGSIEELSLPLGGISVLQAAQDTGRTYRGGTLSPGKPVELMLWRALATAPEPREVAVIPVLADDQVVNLIYVHGAGASYLDDSAVLELEDLAQRAGASYQRLLDAAHEPHR